MSTNELTSTARTPDAPLTYRTLDVEQEVKPFFASELAREVMEATDATDCQLMYLGYSREKDTFLVAYELGLAKDAGRATQVLEVGWERKLFARSFKVTRSTRHAEGFFGALEQACCARLPDLTDLVRS